MDMHAGYSTLHPTFALVFPQYAGLIARVAIVPRREKVADIAKFTFERRV
jgi:hypothetical protein